MMNRKKSDILYEEAKQLFPGGVNSPVRAFLSVNDRPFFVKKGKGAYLFDVDGNAYLDYVASWGAIILGHRHEGLTAEIIAALENGTSYGACHPYEMELARLIREAIPPVEMLRFTSSGTEATMSAIRVARGFSKKKGIIKFRGCYHGHVDSLLVKAGSGMMTYGTPDSDGVIEELARYTFIADFNDIDSVSKIVSNNKDIACIILEPIMGNMGVILPHKGFLENLYELCKKKEIVLICDEVITGFRVTYGGACTMYGIEPDIICLGKIIGGGFPIGAFGGKKEIMEKIAPLGNVYHAGTLSGNPVAVRAGIYVLKYLKDHSPYELFDKQAGILKEHIVKIAAHYNIPYTINSVTGMFTGFFSKKEVSHYTEALEIDRAMYQRFFRYMLEEGIFFAPSPFEASFFTISHGGKEINHTIEAYEKVFARLQ